MRPLRDELARRRADLPDASAAIASGTVLVNGTIVTNPNSLVPPESSIRVRETPPLRGRTKLGTALDRFAVPVAGAVALDAGAAAGGFVQALLDRGARRVYAVEVGHGQLLGSLRQDDRVVNLERTNIASLDRRLVPDALDVVTLDLGYLALAVGLPQLSVLDFAHGATLVALVKPMSELGLGQLPTDRAELEDACSRAVAGVDAAGWDVLDVIESPMVGSRGAIEFFVHGRRRAPEPAPSQG
jgi:23S rRNA (cytidine1920-2'-O)/16S rRNA (cytidine1409-2'-O)-methyltransferase